MLIAATHQWRLEINNLTRRSFPGVAPQLHRSIATSVSQVSDPEDNRPLSANYYRWPIAMASLPNGRCEQLSSDRPTYNGFMGKSWGRYLQPLQSALKRQEINVLVGDPYENRTRVFAVRGRRPNR